MNLWKMNSKVKVTNSSHAKVCGILFLVKLLKSNEKFPEINNQLNPFMFLKYQSIEQMENRNFLD